MKILVCVPLQEAESNEIQGFFINYLCFFIYVILSGVNGINAQFFVCQITCFNPWQLIFE